jgi:very-short-patch-repair endonuclease
LVDQYRLDNEVPLLEIRIGAKGTVNWECGRGHRWAAKIANRIHLGNGCPYCSGHRVIPGETDLETLYPDVAKDWSAKNELLPSQVKPGSLVKVWWDCKVGHDYFACIASRALQGTGCGVCRGLSAYVGYNDLATTDPDVAKFWSAKNTTKVTEVVRGSNKKFIWECELGHEWTTMVYALTIGGNRCPTCSNRVLLIGFNDIATRLPHLVPEWSPKNELSPLEVLFGTHVKYWWICKNSHEWKISLNARSSKTNPSGCPKCNPSPGTSKAEEVFRDEFAKHFQTINTDHLHKVTVPGASKPIQVDIIGTYNDRPIIIEYDGQRFHKIPKNAARDTLNTQLFLDAGYLVVRIRESKKLTNLDLTHPNLLQLTHAYSTEMPAITKTTGIVLNWLQSKG